MSKLEQEMEHLLQQHERVALQFSGGKDSMAVLYLLKPWLSKITVYHLDTGDQTAETFEVVKQVRRWIPHFKLVQTNSRVWRAIHGDPSDLVPCFSTWMGRQMGHSKLAIVDRFTCCWHNVMAPMHDQMVVDKITLIIRGVKSSDMPKLPLSSGAQIAGVDYYYPIQSWTDEQVHAYLVEVGAPRLKIYNFSPSNTDCKTCTAYLEDEHWRYLARFDVESYDIVMQRIRAMHEEIQRQLHPFMKALK